ncbi:g4060 [Coccomyxa elongata]
MHAVRRRRTTVLVAQAACGSQGLAKFHGGVGVVTFGSSLGHIRDTTVDSTELAQAANSASQSGVASFHKGTGSASFSMPVALRNVPSLSLKERLQAYGLAGIVAYGLLNTIYYTAMFTYMWTVVYKVPRGLGFAAAARKFVEVFGITWAGSQLTKAARAGGALLLAPIVDKGLTGLQRTLHLNSRRAAFLCTVFACLGIAAALFGTVVVLHT